MQKRRFVWLLALTVAMIALGGGQASADTIGTVDSTLSTLLGKYDAPPDGTLSTTDPLARQHDPRS